MSDEKKSSEASSPPSLSAPQNSTQTYFSDGQEEEIDEESWQEESSQEEFPEEDEYLEEEYLEEETYLGRDGYEGMHLSESTNLEGKELDSYQEFQEDKFKLANALQATPDFIERSSTSLHLQIPARKTGSQCSSFCGMNPTFHIKDDEHLLALTDQATQTEWTYKSKSTTMLLKSKSKSEQDDSKMSLINEPDLEEDVVVESEEEEENVMASISEMNLFENLMDEPYDAVEAEDLDGKLLRNTSYQTVFRMMLKEMAERSELEEDIEIPMTGHLKSETRRKLGILLKKNFGKYKETILWIMKKRERLLTSQEFGTLTFRLMDHKPPKIKKQLVEEIQKVHHVVQQKKKIELDQEWVMTTIKVHQGDGKVILYPSGTVFQVLFPDGTGQIHYPSGNLAMLIFSVQARHFTYIILEDSDKMWIRALINNSGHATIYDENGDIWLCLSCNLGYYFIGDRNQKAWNWWNLNLHTHAPPVQPITLEINQYIKIHIRSQDKIFFYFIHQTKQIHLNLGTKYKYITPEVLKKMKKKRVQEVEFSATAQKIQILLGKMSKIRNLLTISDLENFVASAKDFLGNTCQKKKSEFQDVVTHLTIPELSQYLQNVSGWENPQEPEENSRPV